MKLTNAQADELDQQIFAHVDAARLDERRKVAEEILSDSEHYWDFASFIENTRNKYLTGRQQGRRAKLSDTERLDWLEMFIETHGAILLHNGRADTNGHYGLGLCPGTMTRSLREAIDSAASSNAPRDGR